MRTNQTHTTSLAARQALALAALLLAATHPAIAAGSDWPQFRGPNSSGVAGGLEPPTHFGPASNVLWKTELPVGHSSPCIRGDRIFLTAYDKPGLETLCLDRRDGSILWRRPAPAQKVEPAHRIGSPASSTPVTDGQRVYVYFGSCGLLAYDFDGREVWRKPLDMPVLEFGTGTSPILAGDRLILDCDQDLGSFLLAVEPSTGKTVWRVERPEFRRGFATPFVWRHDGIEELVVPGSLWLKSYRPEDGAERWTVSGTARVACSSPTASASLLFSASWNVGGDEGERMTMPPFDEFAREHDKNKDGKFTRDEIPAGPIRDRYGQMDLNKDGEVTRAEWEVLADMFVKASNAVLAIRPGGKGDITRTHVVWKVTRSLPYVSSPLYYRGRVYTVKNGGLFSCYDAKSGKPFYQDERLDAPGDYYASPVAIGDQIYLGSQNGVMLVIGTGDALNVLARNKFTEQIFATPAIVDGALYVRTTGHLFAFSPVGRFPKP